MIYIPDPVYNPNFLDDSQINAKTKLGPGVSIAKFLGAYGDRTHFNFVGSAAKRKQIARNLYLQAELYRAINGNTDLFNDVRLIVSEGIYRGGPEETVGGENLKKQEGLLVGYQVINKKGQIDNFRTFDVAEFWKDYFEYEKLILDYDLYSPDETLTSQILIEVPQVPESFEISFSKNVETRFNGTLLSSDELIEVKIK